jgi:hypothetical protein
VLDKTLVAFGVSGRHETWRAAMGMAALAAKSSTRQNTTQRRENSSNVMCVIQWRMQYQYQCSSISMKK